MNDPIMMLLISQISKMYACFQGDNMPINFHIAVHPQPVENSVMIIFLHEDKEPGNKE